MSNIENGQSEAVILKRIQEKQAREAEVREFAVLAVVGQLKLGEGSITTPYKSSAEVEEQNKIVSKHIVEVDDRKCAVCIDGRCACCTAEQITSVSDDGRLNFEPQKPKVRPHIPGGLLFFATLTALTSNLEIVRGAQTFEEAKNRVGDLLTSQGFRDGGHTTDLSYGSLEKTECGAQDGLDGSTTRSHELDIESEAQGITNGLDHAVAALQGEDENIFRSSSTIYRSVRNQTGELIEKGVFATFDSVQHRASFIPENADGLELLTSVPGHPTHGHEEGQIVVVDIPGFTVDRDGYYAETGKQVFIYDRWFINNDLANALTQSEAERKTFEIAADYATAFIANRLVAQGMWVTHISDPRLALAA